MALQRRSGPSPYEVMSGKSGSPSLPGQAKTDREADGSSSADRGRSHDSSGFRGDWREYAGGPVTLRIPRGYLVLGAVLVLLIAFLVYAIGHSRGYEKAKLDADRLEKENTTARNVVRPPLKDDPTSAQTGANSAANPDKTASSQSSGISQYLVLARYTRKEADRLVKFLAGYGVDAAIVSTDNARLFLVVDRHAFDEQEIRQRSAQYEQYKQQIKRLGRLWKEKEKGPTDLADLQPQAFVTKQSK